MQTTIEYTQLTDDDVRTAFILEPAKAEELKMRLLKKIDIVPMKGEKAIDAWIRHLHTINGLEYQKPAHPRIADAIIQSDGARKFMWFIA